jgi:hypothetical protein
MFGVSESPAPVNVFTAPYQGTSPAVPPPAPPYRPPNVSPEATSSINRGGAGTAPPPADFSQRIQQTVAPTAIDYSGTGYTRQNETPQPGQGYGQETGLIPAARVLGDYVAKNGFEGTFVVGGYSPVDPEIDRLTRRINESGGTPQERQQLNGLIQGRESTVQGGAFRYDPKTGQVLPIQAAQPQGKPGGGGAGGAFYSPGNGVVPAPNADLLRQLQELMAAGGVTEGQRGIEESNLVSQLEQGSRRKRQDLADRLAASGVFGGRSADLLSDVSSEADEARATGLASIRGKIFDLQNRSRETALASILQQAGMSADEALAQARLGLDTEMGRGRLALDTARSWGQEDLQRQRLGLDTRTAEAQIQQGLSQLGLDQQQIDLAKQRLGLDTLGYQTETDVQRTNTLLALIQLSSLVEGQDRELIMRLIDQFMSGQS